MQTVHQIEMREKCKKDLDAFKNQNKKLAEDEIFKKYCDGIFNIKNLEVYPTIRKYQTDEELKIKIQRMSQHQLALLELAKIYNFSREQIDQLKNDLEKMNISILKHFIKYYACGTAKAILPMFISLFDADGAPRQYGPYYTNIDGAVHNELEVKSDHDNSFDSFDYNGYEEEVLYLYDFYFEFCGNCDCGASEYCMYSQDL